MPNATLYSTTAYGLESQAQASPAGANDGGAMQNLNSKTLIQGTQAATTTSWYYSYQKLSGSSLIYGNSSTVQPTAVCMYLEFFIN